jgi:predicted nucleotidyltransferase
MATARPSADSLLDELRALRPEFKRRFEIDLIGLGGSQASGTANDESDIDVAVRRIGRIHLGTVVQARDWLATKFGRDVDLVFVDAMPTYKRSLFERGMLVLP